MPKKQELYIFVGENASTGEPNAQTGRMSFYGTVYRVSGGRKAAKEIEAQCYRNYPYGLNVVGGARRMRELCLGSSMRSFEENLKYASTMFIDDDGEIGEY